MVISTHIRQLRRSVKQFTKVRKIRMSRATHFQTSKKPRYRNDNGAYFISVVEPRGHQSNPF